MDKLKMEDMSFEDAIQELEAIIDKLESGEVPLDETISLYDRGSELKKYCELKLQTAEEKIQRISKREPGFEGLEVEDIETK
jgi:exodeoxyribonuclease VII small subunit